MTTNANKSSPPSKQTHYFSGGVKIYLRGRDDFLDGPAWDYLGRKHISKFILPSWADPCTPQEMRRWLSRLDLSERDYEKLTATSFEDFIALNPDWPLRAWIGLMCEAKQ